VIRRPTILASTRALPLLAEAPARGATGLGAELAVADM